MTRQESLINIIAGTNYADREDIALPWLKTALLARSGPRARRGFDAGPNGQGSYANSGAPRTEHAEPDADVLFQATRPETCGPRWLPRCEAAAAIPERDPSLSA